MALYGALTDLTDGSDNGFGALRRQANPSLFDVLSTSSYGWHNDIWDEMLTVSSNEMCFKITRLLFRPRCLPGEPSRQIYDIPEATSEIVI